MAHSAGRTPGTDRVDARRELPGAPESRLAAGLAADLPDATPAPPWRCRVEAVVWWHRAPVAAQAALPDAVRGRGPWPLVVGAVVHYLDSPVGPYREVLGALVSLSARPTVHVPFIAVDSLASVHGGRAHWALPKTLASFTSGPAGSTRASAAGWEVDVRPAPVGPRLPVAGRLRLLQATATGGTVTGTTTAYARARAARVGVRVGTDTAGDPGSIAGWLRSGRHRGLVLSGRLRVA